jgi:hypothetical protein
MELQGQERVLRVDRFAQSKKYRVCERFSAFQAFLQHCSAHAGSLMQNSAAAVACVHWHSVWLMFPAKVSHKVFVMNFLFPVCGTGGTAAAYMRVPYNGGQRRNASHEALDWQNFSVSFCEPIHGWRRGKPARCGVFPKFVRQIQVKVSHERLDWLNVLTGAGAASERSGH